MVNNDANHSNNNSDNTTTTEANNNDNTTNGSATSPVVLRRASGDSRRRSGRRSPTAAAGVSLRSGGGIRRGILKRPRAHHTTSSEEAPYVPAPVPEIIANIEDARIPVERDSDLTPEERAAKFERGLAIRRATATRYYTEETMERISFYEMLADGRRDFRLTFGMEQAQTFALGDIPHAAAAPEEEEFAPVRLTEPEDNFAANIVDLALLAVQDGTTANLDRSIWDTVTHGVKAAVSAIHHLEQGAEPSLADHFAMEDRLEAKTDAHAGELVERAKAHLEHVVTDAERPAKEAAFVRRKELVKKRQTAPSTGPDAWTRADYKELLEASALHEPRFMTQRFLGGARRLKGLNKHLNVGSATLVRQMERIREILRRTWAERRRLAAGHRAAVAAATAGN